MCACNFNVAPCCHDHVPIKKHFVIDVRLLLLNSHFLKFKHSVALLSCFLLLLCATGVDFVTLVDLLPRGSPTGLLSDLEEEV